MPWAKSAASMAIVPLPHIGLTKDVLPFQPVVMIIAAARDSVSVPQAGSSGIPLAAPMQETLAAAIIITAGWNGGHLSSIQCAEAGRLPSRLRSWPKARRRGSSAVITDSPTGKGSIRLPGRRFGRRRTGRRRNRRRGSSPRTSTPMPWPRHVRTPVTAGVEKLIEFAVCPFAETPVPEGGGVVVLNPPYGERTGEVSKLIGLYREIGDFFKQKCGGYRGYIFTGNMALGKQVGLRPKRRITFYNSGIECRLLEYELYEGTRRKETVKNYSSNP